MRKLTTDGRLQDHRLQVKFSGDPFTYSLSRNWLSSKAMFEDWLSHVPTEYNFNAIRACFLATEITDRRCDTVIKTEAAGLCRFPKDASLVYHFPNIRMSEY